MNMDIVWQTIHHDLSDGVYILDEHMKIAYINQRAIDLLNLCPSLLNTDATSDTLKGKHCHDVSKGVLCGKTCALGNSIIDNQSYDNIEVEIKVSSDVSRWINLNTRPIYDENRELIGVAGIAKEIPDKIVEVKKHAKQPDFSKIVGRSFAMLDMYEAIKQVAPTHATVMILGESGTGKELVAEACHKLSKNTNGPLVKINCSALSENLLESELFGHEKGSFTGAIKEKIGKFELAHGGTIFLDEIGEINPSVQIKLLRVIQEKEIEKVGGNKTIKVDTRIVAATNRDLKKEVREGRFREDLYYRLNVFPIKVPPLRKRRGDIELLIAFFIERFTQSTGKQIQMSEDTKGLLISYDWPGNVRELEHAIEYAVIRAGDKIITPKDLPEDITEVNTIPVSIPEHDGLIQPDLDQETVYKVLEQTGWNKSKASKMLNIGRTTLWRLMKKYQIDDPSH